MTDALERTPWRSWVMLATLMLFYVFGFLDRIVMSMIVDPMRADLGISDFQVSLLMGLSFAIFYAIGGLPLGWLVDRFQRRWVIYLGVTAWGIAQACSGLAGTFGQMFIARMMVGVGESSMMPSSHSLISDAFPRHRLSMAVSLFSMGSIIGVAISNFAGGQLVERLLAHGIFHLPVIGDTQPWKMVFLATGLPGVLLAGLIFLSPEPLRRGRLATAAGTAARSMWPYLRQNWRLWLIFTLVFGVMNIAFGAMIYWQPAYFSRFYHWSPSQYGIALGLVSAIGGGGGLIFSGWMIDRMYARGIKDAPLRYYGWALALSTPFALVALLTSNVWLYLGLIWIAQMFTVNFLGFASAAVQLTTPNELRGRMSALFTTVLVGLIGSVLGTSVPVLLAEHVLHDQVRLGRAIALTIAICVPIALITIVLGLKTFREAVIEAETWR